MIQFEPIGFVQAEQKYKYQQPRQGEFAQNFGKITLLPGRNFEQALEDLHLFSKIWVIYLFHHNNDWKPKVNPPISPDGKKKGVFATRSPYRPNPIGLSCIDLVSIEGLTLNIANFDLLDETPILDIKPYISHYDSHPTALTGWLPEELPPEYQISVTPEAELMCKWIYNHNGPDLIDFALVQLSTDPYNNKRKRVSQTGETNWTLACRTWRIHFSEKNMEITIFSISSGYNDTELAPDSPDIYEDKDIHRGFQSFLKQPPQQ